MNNRHGLKEGKLALLLAKCEGQRKVSGEQRKDGLESRGFRLIKMAARKEGEHEIPGLGGKLQLSGQFKGSSKKVNRGKEPSPEGPATDLATLQSGRPP